MKTKLNVEERKTAKILAVLSLLFLGLLGACGGSTEDENTNNASGPQTKAETFGAPQGWKVIEGSVNLKSRDGSALSLVQADTGVCGLSVTLPGGLPDGVDSSQLKCFCKENGVDYACVFPPHTMAEFGVANEGVNVCTFNYEIDVGDSQNYVAGVLQVAEDVAHDAITCVDGTATVSASATANSITDAFKDLVKAGLPSKETTEALSFADGYDAHILSMFDETQKQAVGCYTGNCGSNQDYGLIDDHCYEEVGIDGTIYTLCDSDGTENCYEETNIDGDTFQICNNNDGDYDYDYSDSDCYEETDEYGNINTICDDYKDDYSNTYDDGCYEDYDESGNPFTNCGPDDANASYDPYIDDQGNHYNPDYQGPPPMEMGGNFSEKFGFDSFNPIACDGAGYKIPDFIFEEFMAQNYKKVDDLKFQKSGAHFDFEYINEDECDLDTASNPSDCRVNMTVKISGHDGVEEVLNFDNVPLTGFENTFMLRGEKELDNIEIKDRALREWGREFLSQRDEYFVPMDLPHPDSFCEPINLVNRVRQYFGYDSLDNDDNEAYTGIFPGSEWEQYHFDQFNDEQELCSNVEDDPNDREESTLMTLETFCVKANGNIRTKANLLEDYADYFAITESNDDADLFIGQDDNKNGLIDNYDWFGQNDCYGDSDNDGILNWLDKYPHSEAVTDDESGDPDMDYYYGDDDNCPLHQNWDQADEDEDGVGNACDEDYDQRVTYINSSESQGDYGWCQTDLAWRFDYEEFHDSEEYYTLDDDDNYVVVDSDSDDIPDVIDSCLDGSGYFKKKSTSEISCVANKGSDALKEYALLSATSVCEAYDSKNSVEYWNNKIYDATTGDKLGFCRPHGDDKDRVGSCSNSTTENKCNNSGNCWWKNEFSFHEDMTALRLVGIDLNVAQWSDEWSVTELFADDSYEWEWPHNTFQPHNWWQIDMSEADEAIFDGGEDTQDWKFQELENIHREISECRERFSGNNADLKRKTTFITGILASIERVGSLEDKDGNLKYICGAVLSEDDKEACLESPLSYDSERGLECAQGQMTQCEFSNLQDVLRQAGERLTQWASAQAVINDTYKYIEDAVEVSGEKSCLADNFADTEESDDTELVDQLSSFVQAYGEDIAEAQKKSFNHLRCIEMDKNISLVKESCMIAPAYGKKSAYSKSVIDDLFLTKENSFSLTEKEKRNADGCLEGEFRNHQGECEEEIICALPPGVTSEHRTQCIDDIVAKATIASGCEAGSITEKYAFMGTMALNDLWNDGAPIHKDDLLAKMIMMTSHADGVDALFGCKITVTVADYDENGCWIYEAPDETLASELKTTCLDEEGNDIEDCKLRSDYLDVEWKRSTKQEIIDMGSIADRQIIKMKLTKTREEQSARTLAEDFESFLDDNLLEQEEASNNINQ